MTHADSANNILSRRGNKAMKFSAVAVLLFICVTIGVVSGAPTDTEVVEVKDTDNEVLERHTRQAGTCGCSLTVYDHPNFGGRSLLILQQNAYFKNNWFTDRVESAIISGSCSWLMYSDKDFNREFYTNGSSHFLQPGRHYYSTISWGGTPNRINSARALPPDGTIAIAVFSHADFEGRMEILFESVNHFAELQFDNHVGSVIVLGGTWRLYSDPDYNGVYSQFGVGQYPNIHSERVGGDTLSSVQLV